MSVTQSFIKKLVIFLFAITFCGFSPWQVLASTSSNYQIQEDFVGGGGVIDSSSANYHSMDSVGAVGVGDGSSTNYQTQSGYTTTNDPTLTFIVNNTSASLGSLSTGSTATATATFQVLNYTSYGYIVQTLGAPPTNGAHPLNNLSSPTASSAGTEQYGINLVANTSPATFGANPSQVPNSTFSFGVAASGYNTTNLYKYVAGDTIASAPKTSGQTTFTISYIANMALSTPGGSYSGAQTLVVVGTY